MIKTVGDLRRAISGLDDDFTIDLRLHRTLTEDELKGMSYPYPIETNHNCILELDDIGYSEKIIAIGIDIDNVKFNK